MEDNVIKTIKTSRFTMNYIKFGSGSTPFVIIPGISVKPVTNSWRSIEKQYSALKNDYTVYLFDRINELKTGYTVKDMAKDTVTAIKKLKLKDIVLFGTSQGGMIAEVIAINEPKLIKKMILGSTLAKTYPESLQTFNEWQELSNNGDIKLLNKSVFEKIYSEEYLKKYERAFNFLINAGNEEDIKRFSVLVDACKKFDVYDELTKIKCKTFVIGSYKDKVVSGQASVDIAKAIPNAKLYMYDNFSHSVYDEDGEYLSKIIDFLNE